VVCGPCLGTGRRRPEVGEFVFSGRPTPVGDLNWRDAEDGGWELFIQVTPERGHLLLPTIEEVEIAEREEAHPCQSE
jgi:hypothetical protein